MARQLRMPLRAERKYDEDASESDSDAQSAQSSPPSSADEMDEDIEPSDEDMSGEDQDNSEDDPEEASESDEDDKVQSSLRNISFGALASAQDSLHRPPTSKPTASSSRTDASKVNALRARLAELKDLKANRSSTTTSTSTSTSTHPTTHSRHQRPSDTPSTRTSKHAPTEQTSKRQVSRYRPVVADLSSNPTHIRDPRFTPSDLAPSESEKLRRNYSFLSSYRTSEISTLKTALGALKAVAKKRKSHSLTPAEEQEKERLYKTINALENKEKAERKKEKEREVVQGHRREEREKVKAGKAPFFLKKSEVKKKALTVRWEGMKGGEREKALKRRRKKISERERRAMPGERRSREV